MSSKRKGKLPATGDANGNPAVETLRRPRKSAATRSASPSRPASNGHSATPPAASNLGTGRAAGESSNLATSHAEPGSTVDGQNAPPNGQPAIPPEPAQDPLIDPSLMVEASSQAAAPTTAADLGQAQPMDLDENVNGTQDAAPQAPTAAAEGVSQLTNGGQAQ